MEVMPYNEGRVLATEISSLTTPLVLIDVDPHKRGLRMN
jgi:hypothetical protein